MKAMAAAALAVALVTLAGVAAQAALRIDQAVGARPASAVPVRLAAGGLGSTTLGASATSATTVGVALPPVGAATVLSVEPGSRPWDLRLRAVSATYGGLDSLTVSLAGATTATQVTVAGGVLGQGPGAAVPLGALPVTVAVAGSCAGTCVLDLRLQVASPGGAVLAEYPYKLTVT